MTFIASVVAKDGVALIADSLVTTSSLSLEWGAFIEHVVDKGKTLPTDGSLKLDAKEVSNLFKRKASHTMDYEEKLFELDNYEAITTAGNAVINGKRIGQIIEEFKVSMKALKNSKPRSLKGKMNLFCKHVEKEIKAHLKNEHSIGVTNFILTSFDKKKSKTTIYKINTTEASKTDLEDKGFEFVKVPDKEEPYRVVCDGQNRISDMVLFGGVRTNVLLCYKIFQFIKSDLGLGSDKIGNEDEYLNKLYGLCFSNEFMENMSIHKLTNLSLQQAVDLATLLMNLEISFQKYTKNIPTVGGVVKIAVINKGGFKFISGHEIHAPISG